MTADSSRPLTDSERRRLDALAVGLAHSDPSFVTTMRTGRPAGARCGGSRRRQGVRLLATGVTRLAMLLGACLLAAAISIGALLLGPVAVVALGPALLVGVGLVALRRHGRSRS